MVGIANGILERLGIKNTDITRVLKPGQLEHMTPDEAVTATVDNALRRKGVLQGKTVEDEVAESTADRAARVLKQLHDQQKVTSLGTATREIAAVDQRVDQLSQLRKGK